MQVLSSQNGGIFGEFSNIEVEVAGCSSSATGTAIYQQFSLSVAFQLQGQVCEDSLPRAAVIGIATGAAVGGVLIAVVVALIVKAMVASYTREAAAKIKMKELQEPLLH